MASFEELMESLRNPGEDGPGETIYDDLTAAYNDRVGAGDAKVTELTAALDESNGKLTKVMAHNYELLTAVEVGNPEDVNGDLDEVNEGEAEVTTFDDLISYG
jgi:hypothetical protein